MTDAKDLKQLTKAELIAKITRMEIVLNGMHPHVAKFAKTEPDSVTVTEASETFHIPNFRGVRRFTVTEVTTLEGSGVEHDPSRLVRWVYDDDGNIIAVVDGFEGGHPRFRSHADQLERERS